MKKHYPWLWFDADGTLLDYDRSEGVALEQAFQSVGMSFKDEYLVAYRRINRQLWQALERREIIPAVLQVRRFEMLLEEVAVDGHANRLSTAYLERLAMCADLIDGAAEVLNELRKRCRIAVVTNGLRVVQRSRFALSSIREHVSELIISEEVGAPKPKAAFFEAASARLGHPAKDEILIVGDSLSSDIQGGADYGLDTCWFNPAREPRPDGLRITHEIAHLRELLEVLG